MSIRVVVHGALGKMGTQVIEAVSQAAGMVAVGAVDKFADSTTLTLDDGTALPLSQDLVSQLDGVDVVVDFSTADGAREVIETSTANGVNVVVGSTGLTNEDYKTAKRQAEEGGVGVIIAPNFAIGAVLLIYLARKASPFFEYADLIETHHEAKIDSPSGTALAIASAAIEGKGGPFISKESEKELVAGARGGVHEGVNIHSARMPGRVAHHELVFGALGQTLTLRHDSINRESFMPGVVLAINEVIQQNGLVVGLENVMGLSD